MFVWLGVKFVAPPPSLPPSLPPPPHKHTRCFRQCQTIIVFIKTRKNSYSNLALIVIEKKK